ncbi:MAG TPA: DUF3570 domain-containing protein [Rudaea sp.]|nr:DUF3570 domain-containing protein [Rudaea sp.]
MSAATTLVPEAHAQTATGAETDAHVSYRFNEYDEDAFAPRPIIGSPDRYGVISQQFQLATPVGSDSALSASATHEVMSGSSPWYVVPGPGNRPIQVMSGATIRDHRNELRASWTQGTGSSGGTTYSASYSAERDYHATALGIERSIPLSTALTLGVGGSFSHDLISPTDAELYGRVQHAQKNTGSVFGSLAWIIDRSSVLQTGIQINSEHGFLSDPYKLVTVGTGTIHDLRPDRRDQAAWLVRYRHAFNKPDAALHLDYRYAQDSWGVVSHTFDAAWYQTLPARWVLVPELRYYSQQQARFYAPFFTDPAAHNFYTSDYRLGTFGAFSASINLRKRIGSWEFSGGIERYHGATDYALGGADAAVPAVVSYTRAFIGLDYLLQ